MSGSQPRARQTRASSKSDADVEQFVRTLLVALLPLSIASRSEKGGVVCRNPHTGALTSGEILDGHALGVDIGLDEPNCGCPEGTKPVAFWHTHPTAGDTAGTVHGDPDFSKQDKRLANEHQITAFLGSFDGLFRRYRPVAVTTTMVAGVGPVQNATDDKGNVLPETFNETEILPGRLPTKAPAAAPPPVFVRPPR